MQLGAAGDRGAVWLFWGMQLLHISFGCCSAQQSTCMPGNLISPFGPDAVAYSQSVADTNFLPSPGLTAHILESEYHLLQIFGDLSMRRTNFYDEDYNGVVFWCEARCVYPRLSSILKADFPIPELFFSASLKGLKQIDWEDRLDYGIGVEWRPFNGMKALDMDAIRWVQHVRFYSIAYQTEYLQYRNDWGWRPKADIRFGCELYKENNFYDQKFLWSEIWGDASWRETNFYVNDYNSWTFSVAPKFGFKVKREAECCIMPYLTCELSLTQRSEFWQNRLVGGGGIQVMPFRWNESGANVFIKSFRLYVEGNWSMRYFAAQAPASVPRFDFRAGINYAINRW